MPEEYFTPANIALCGERAKGGAGIVTIGENPSDCSAGKTRGRMVPSMQKRYSLLRSTVPMRIKHHSAVNSIELIHAGRRAHLSSKTGTSSGKPDALKIYEL